MSTREQLEAEAAELYPAVTISRQFGREDFNSGARYAHVRAKTISAEQVEAAADRSRQIETGKNPGDMRDVLRAAGLFIGDHQ